MASAAKLPASAGNHKEFTVKSKAKGDKISSISIRVGTFGDEDLSQAIFDKIKKNL